MKKSILIFLVLAAMALSIKAINRNGEEKRLDRQDYVPDEKTAIKVAEAIWYPIFGDKIEKEKPFKALLIGDSVWYVHGTLPPDMLGGTVNIEIQKSDCKILKVSHGK